MHQSNVFPDAMHPNVHVTDLLKRFAAHVRSHDVPPFCQILPVVSQFICLVDDLKAILFSFALHLVPLHFLALLWILLLFVLVSIFNGWMTKTFDLSELIVLLSKSPSHCFCTWPVCPYCTAYRKSNFVYLLYSLPVRFSFSYVHVTHDYAMLFSVFPFHPSIVLFLQIYLDHPLFSTCSRPPIYFVHNFYLFRILTVHSTSYPFILLENSCALFF